MTIIIGSVISGFIVGVLATFLAANTVKRDRGEAQGQGDTPIFDTIKPSLTILEAEAITRAAAAAAAWNAIKAGER